MLGRTWFSKRSTISFFASKLQGYTAEKVHRLLHSRILQRVRRARQGSRVLPMTMEMFWVVHSSSGAVLLEVQRLRANRDTTA